MVPLKMQPVLHNFCLENEPRRRCAIATLVWIAFLFLIKEACNYSTLTWWSAVFGPCKLDKRLLSSCRSRQIDLQPDKWIVLFTWLSENRWHCHGKSWTRVSASVLSTRADFCPLSVLVWGPRLINDGCLCPRLARAPGTLPGGHSEPGVSAAPHGGDS